MKFGIKYYWHPTPKKIRLFGDSLVAASTFASTLTILNGDKTLTLIIFIGGWLGKFISNMFADDQQKINNNPPEASN